MKFSTVHKVSSYLMAACAFLALALSQELPPVSAFLGAAGIVASWFWESPRVRIERWTVWWNVLAVAAFVFTVIQAFSTGEPVIAGSSFLVFLLVAKLFNRRSSRDYQWVYALSFLMLVAGTTLNAEISYALCFLGYVVSATWALILFHLRREMEENFLLKHTDQGASERVEVERILSSRRIVGGKFLAATASVSLAIFFFAALLFLVFPRVGFGLFFRGSQQRLTFAGFSDGVQLGGHGLIRTDPTVVMRVKLDDPRFHGAAAPQLHWRGVAFDRYRQGKWTRSPQAFRTRADTSVGATRTRVKLDAARTFGADLGQALRQEIFLEPLDTATLFAASTPLAFELEHVVPRRAGMLGRFTQNDEVRYSDGQGAGVRYVAYSNPMPPDPARLAAAPDANLRDYTAYLQLPAELTPRVRELAHRITEGKHGPYQKAEAILAYLRSSYGYTLEMQSPGDLEPLDHFLFVRKKGHCEYFSTAMAILLRVAHVPTRNVDGFLGGEWNEYGQYVAVRGGDAHSWVEVWFEGVGWVTYDPTPAAQSSPLPRGGGDFVDKLRRMMDTLRLQYFRWVIDYDLGRQVGLFRSIGNFFKGGEDGGQGGRAATAWIAENKKELAGVLGAGVAAAAAIILWRRRRAPSEGGRPRAGRDHPIVAEYARAARTLAGQGLGRAPGQTPREHAASLRARATPAAEPYAALTELYYDARYAGADVDLERARALGAEVRHAFRRR
jgi:hypothetical protein